MGFNLQNYVNVEERLNEAQALIHGVTADRPVMLNDHYGFIRVKVELSDGRWATGVSSFDLELDGKSADATNPLEVCETSALGRALKHLGFAASRSVPSREEMVTAQRRQDARR